jgi:hypothetical protein
MATTFGTALRVATITAIAKHFDNSTPTWAPGTGGGVLILLTSADVQCVIISVPSPCFTIGGTGSITKAGTWSGPVTAAGTVTKFIFSADGGDTQTYTGTVGMGSGDISLDNNVLSLGGTVTMSTFTITQPAS